MGHIFNCLGRPILNDLPDYFANALHLIEAKAIAPGHVAKHARGGDVSFDVGERVVNAVEPPRRIRCAAVDTGLLNDGEKLICSEVASVKFLICSSKKDRAALFRLRVPLLS